jgi:RNA 3'-terminal phosphate cyclase (ATP)
VLDLDGSAGGGQLVRSSLSLSMLTGRAFRMTDVRGGRPKPGLRPQHLACVDLAAAICDADVEGASIGSEELSFDPGRPRGGDYEVDVGTAGSVTLLLDVVLPLSCRIDEPLSAAVTGGTDVKWSPTAAFYRAVKLPLLRRRGLRAALDVERAGFYPVGGGDVRLSAAPSRLAPIDLTDRGPLDGVRVYSKASTDLADAEVAERQASAAVEALRTAGVVGQETDRSSPPESGEASAPDAGEARDADDALDPDAAAPVLERSASYVASNSPGSALAVRLDYANSIAGFDALGERGKPAEDVGGEAAEAAAEFHAGGGAVDAHTADQLAIFLALVGGRVRVPRVTDHVATSVDLLGAFGFDVRVDETGDRPALVGE